MAQLPTGTVTFLFTDLEGSTRLWEEHPEAMRAALARHDEILRDAVEKRGGHVVKTTGDGLHAAFAVAADAVAAAIDAQRALVDEAVDAARAAPGAHGPAHRRRRDPRRRLLRPRGQPRRARLGARRTAARSSSRTRPRS